ncbi:MAG: hydrogenase 4 subunit B [Candidatus Magasanikbacteria bacterium RIFOXYD2_FULL_36_9]|uniref:Hydrogenase 4 subunit B n=1 Tax=Candidatus Magasanikbacteria bacterium RIFOXYD2_FULL_36_9 TaxID=1798707 RepID=A0A1F6NZ06_9BACT|nr:MAG: hydrogenase 4 subunit B [Candidatus Magasanikbacteria bacterium RIFOXYD2_FULL_36_9]
MLNYLFTPSSLVVAVGLFMIGALGALLFNKNNQLANWWGNLSATLGSSLALIFSSNVLITKIPQTVELFSSTQFLSLTLRVDLLSAFFIFVISLLGLLCSVYGLGYVKHYYNKYNLGVLGFFYNMFIASMILVVAANNVLFFLIAWEIMSLASYFLVIYEHREDENIKAGFLYFIMTHIGTAFIILSFLLLYKLTGSLEFEKIKSGMVGASGFIQSVIFVCALIGFGTKAGIIPFHIWLPKAHPVAPSHVSALMSGVMIKTGIYMLVRFTFDFLPSTPLWWGVVVLIIGAVSSLLGVLYALSEHDFKRLLAYHSIENIGIILLGLGSALVFLSLGMKSLAVMGLLAALYHTINHAVFKALLFLGAGSVISATHTRNIEDYGGLIKYMPQTAFFFLIGSMAISALPPFNGFVSEWLTFQSMFNAVATVGALTKVLFILAIGALAFTSGLAVMCFVKVFGATFLARPRSSHVSEAREVGWAMRFGMAMLALVALILGLSAGTVSKILTNVVTNLNNLKNSDSVISSTINVVNANNFATMSMPTAFSSIFIIIIIVAVLVYIVTRKQKVSTSITWDCGTNMEPRMEITATGFARSIITIFGTILRPTQQTKVEYREAGLRYFPKSTSIHFGLKDVYSIYFYKPVQEFVLWISEKTKKIQNGNINVYILYIFAILIGLLLIFVK